MFAEINVWVDIAAILMLIAPVGFWSFQIAGNLITGRYYRKFIEKQWPHHDEAIPAKPKIIHALNLVLMIALGISGLYLRFPFFAGGRDAMKLIHFICMYIWVINAFTRVLYAHNNDSHHFKITITDIINAPKVLLYYAFVKKSYPHLTKYNIMQKMTYGYVFPTLLVVQTLTGFAMVWPEFILGWAADYFGGITAAVAWLRIVHFVSAIVFLKMTLIHAFLAITEDLPAFLNFFGLAGEKSYKVRTHAIDHERMSQEIMSEEISQEDQRAQRARAFEAKELGNG